MTRSGFLTPSSFKDIMTVSKSYKTKQELEFELSKLAKAQHEREQKNRTSTKIYTDTEERIAELPALILNWSPVSRFGDTAITYAKKVALGRFGITMPEIKAGSLEHGKAFEPEARAAYEARTGYEFPAENFRMVSLRYPFIAGEADGAIYGREAKWGGEIKCPFNPINHLENLTGDSQLDTYKWQTAGYCSPWMYDWDGFTFISYHGLFPGDSKLHFSDHERDILLESELEETLILFEMEVVRPMVAEFEQLFNTNVDDKWKF
jgi:hypothetical protein